MTDVDKELRELLHEKARDATIAPSAPRHVVSRSHRRQFGTALFAGITATLVVAASVAGLKWVHAGDATSPGGPNDLGERTATIQDFTITAPTGWTLIDWGPSNPTAISLTAASPQTPPPASLVYVHPSPVLELANIDPGLDKRAACSADAVVGSTDAILLIVLGSDGTSATPGSWPAPIDPNAPPVAGPCGVGSYASFSLSGLPYFAFLGIGNAVGDVDRQTLLDAYAGMQAQTTVPATAALVPPGAIGYVLAAGVEQGIPWRLELGPPLASPTTAANTPKTGCLRVVAGNDHGFGCTPFSEATAAGSLGLRGELVVDRIFVDGAVLTDATAVEYQAAGQDPVAATILEVPDSVRSSIASISGGETPSRLFWMLVDQSEATAVPPGRIVQLAADGSQLSSQPIGLVGLDSSSGALARSDLRNALVAAKTHYTDGASYVGFTPDVANGIEPSLTYNASSTAVDGEVSIRDVTATTVLLVTATNDGSVWCIADDTSTSTTSYGTVDAQTAAECVGGDAAWAIVPAASPTSSPSSSLHPIETGTDLGVTWTLLASLDHQQYCVEFDAGSTGAGVCGASAANTPAPGPSAEAPALVTTSPVANGEFLIESVPNSVRRIDVDASSGATFTGACVEPRLIPALMTRGIRFCMVPLAGSDSGTLHFLAADGSAPFPSQTIDWSNQGSSGATGAIGSS